MHDAISASVSSIREASSVKDSPNSSGAPFAVLSGVELVDDVPPPHDAVSDATVAASVTVANAVVRRRVGLVSVRIVAGLLGRSDVHSTMTPPR
jgi:hypothetical protein